MFAGFLEVGLIRRARKKTLFEVRVHNLRDYARGKHRQVDDRPFGGDEGMVFMPEPVFAAVEAVRESPRTPVYLLSPQGRRFSPALAAELAAQPQVILICGRYEGVDERVVQHLVQDEISIGDYVLSGGELAAAVVIDAIGRLQEGALNDSESANQDSFEDGLLDCPHYTRSDSLGTDGVPPVLLSGDHAAIKRWRRQQSLGRTWLRRPDLLERLELSPEDQKLLSAFRAALPPDPNKPEKP